MDPEKRAKRILKHSALYRSMSNYHGELPEGLRKQNDELIGVYNPDAADQRDTLWISDKGIWKFDDEWVLLAYRQIAKILYPQEKLSDADLIIILLNGSAESIRVIGRNGRLRDLYTIGRFLQQCKLDAERLAVRAPDKSPAKD